MIVPPPIPKVFDYPATMGIALDVLFVTFLIVIVHKFDASKGVLTVSLLIVLAFIALAILSVFFTVPTDEITSAVIGGLVAAFGAVIAHWIAKE
jgi:hypothetical protein